ncbi:MAG: NAD-dependent epimerase/dehydratase family protein [Acidobacteriaceae bacterium]
MRFAVTGASGFIGRHVLAELCKENRDTVAVTRDAAHLTGLPASVRVVEMDISAPGDGDECLAALGYPEVLIHLAWDGLPNYGALHHFETELQRQYMFLKSLITAGLPALLVTGTCFEYGNRHGPISEGSATSPTNPYGYAKNALRTQLEFLRKVAPFSLTWARLFYMYGDGQTGTSLYPSLRDSVLRGDKVFKMSGGEQLRDYLPVNEVAHYLVQLAMLRMDIGPVNVCSGHPIAVRRLVEQWLHDNGWNIDLSLGHYPYPDYEPLAFWGDRTRLDQILK